MMELSYFIFYMGFPYHINVHGAEVVNSNFHYMDPGLLRSESCLLHEKVYFGDLFREWFSLEIRQSNLRC